MKQKNFFYGATIIILFTLPVVLNAQRRVIYDLPDAKMNSETICGDRRVCDPGPNRGIVFRFAVRPYSPDINDNSTLKSIAASVLGHAVAASQENSEELNVCSSDGITSMISENDVTASGRYGLLGKAFNYRVSKKLQIDVTAAAQATIEEMLKNRPDRQQLFDSLRAELEAVFHRLKDNQLEVSANYSEWSLNGNTINRIKHATEFAACREMLKQNNWAFITDIGLINYNISLNNQLIRNFGLDLTTKLKREGLNINVGALIEREVHKSLTSQIVQGYQIIGWRKSTIK